MQRQQGAQVVVPRRLRAASRPPSAPPSLACRSCLPTGRVRCTACSVCAPACVGESGWRPGLLAAALALPRLPPPLPASKQPRARDSGGNTKHLAVSGHSRSAARVCGGATGVPRRLRFMQGKNSSDRPFSSLE
eukprot:358582-Chlamydomonas_euryale.AAC.1